jgi:methylaspartate mutase epsilon subunit
MGQFPHEREKAAALIAGSTLISSLINADKIVVKTVDEALGVPRAEINAEAVDTVRYLLRIFSCAQPVTSVLVEREAALIESEVCGLLQAVFDLPGTVLWESIARAFQLGWLDVPFAPHSDNANKLISMRDANGSIRIADPGKLPLSAVDVLAEQECLSSRADQHDKTYRQMLADINMMV